MYLIKFMPKDSCYIGIKKLCVADENYPTIITLLVENNYMITESFYDSDYDKGLEIIRELKKSQKPEDLEFGKSR